MYNISFKQSSHASMTQEMIKIFWISVVYLMATRAIPARPRNGRADYVDNRTEYVDNRTEYVDSRMEYVDNRMEYADRTEYVDNLAEREEKNDAFSYRELESFININSNLLPASDLDVDGASLEEIFELSDGMVDLMLRKQNVTLYLHSEVRKIYNEHQTWSSSRIKFISSIQNYFVKRNIYFPFTETSLSMTSSVTTKTAEQHIQSDKLVFGDLARINKKDQLMEGLTTQAHHISLQEDENKRTPLGEGSEEDFDADGSMTLSSNELSLAEVTSCERVNWLNGNRWLRIVAICPRDWDDQTTRSLCESWESLNNLNIVEKVMLPVQDNRGIVYANAQCAVCHNISSYRPWTRSILCHNVTSMANQIAAFTDMEILFSNLEGSDCQRQVVPSMSEATVECDGDAFQVMSYNNRRVRRTADSAGSSYPTSFNVLMNFDFAGNTHVLFSSVEQATGDDDTSRCQESETFDPYVQSCRPITCSPPYSLVGNKCLQTDNDSSSDESVTDLSQLKTQTAIVFLRLNITLNDYMIMKFHHTKLDFKPQIADHLNISQERIKDLNITYDFGLLDALAKRVANLSLEDYENLLYGAMRPGDAKVRLDLEKKLGQTNQAIWKSFRPDMLEFKLNPRDSPPPPEYWGDDVEHKKFDQEMFMSPYEKTSPANPTFITPDNVGDAASNRSANVKKLFIMAKLAHLLKLNNSNKHHYRREKGTSKPGSSHWSKGSWQKTLIKHRNESFDNQSVLTTTRYNNYVHDKSKQPRTESHPPGNITGRSSPVKGREQSISQVSQQNISMKITFILVPADDPRSSDEEVESLKMKISKLIIEQQFTLTLNGEPVNPVVTEENGQGFSDTKEFCPFGIEYFVYGKEFVLLNINNNTVLYVNKTKTYVEVGLFDLYMLISGSNSAEVTNITSKVQSAFVCFMPRILQSDCPRLNVTSQEYNTTGPNRSIIFEEKEYTIFSYEVVEQSTGKVQICVPFSNEKVNLSGANRCGSDFHSLVKVEGYLTLILGRISTAALVCVILTYLLFHKLRNLPGLNTVSLAFCLLISQVIFSEGIEEPRHWLCQAVAVSLHYFLLCAHFWMNVITFDLYNTFTCHSVLSHAREHGKRFLKYSVYACGVPLLIVSSCLVIEFSDLFKGVAIGYGGGVMHPGTSSSVNYQEYTKTSDKVTGTYSSANYSPRTHSCWITKPLAALFAFGVIIMTIFLVNCVLFGKTIMSISQAAKTAKMSLTTSYNTLADRSEVMLYLKMSSVMGFTWVFGLSSSIVSSFVQTATSAVCIAVHVLSILFIIFNTSQGIFIFVAFVCNRRVFVLYNNLMVKMNKLLFKRKIKESLYSASSRSVSERSSN